ncbi:UDP-glucose 4-epimerase GalE [Quadrisphaera sp. DSM 44207]|uniref:UDP-glucose 4-epimerase GalE n=1 Tax=Quadrisphaera sp. DSM 44207 TaxID=1881057 RepID=UPI00088B7EB2|nr:UDP-glucose 4-epimerase GalE [Quadrisphaera sp. DSM 44207]SDQ84638.1 UDP-glucose 4-epimerase [Quadrisphaera sp. DSM 44207]
MRILVTGGAGYIGSHTVVSLLEDGHDVVVVDDLSNSRREALRRVTEITGRPVDLHQVDLLDEPGLTGVFELTRPEAVVHFAGLKAVGESVAQPERYYRTNVVGTLNLVRAMAGVDCRTIVFSSSATVYGAATRVPLTEDSPRGATNPYGWTKFMIEQVLRDVAAADERWAVALLRYFNPVGAHPSGRIGEDPQGVPNNLVPFIAQVAVGRREELSVYGNDYDTPDGTGVRDYIHVMDLAEGHLAALRRVREVGGAHAWNLGTGRGSSVLDVVKAFEEASGRTIPVTVLPRRPGDVAVSYADPARAREELGWEARRDLAQMCADTWRWQQANPHGYGDAG